MNRTLFNELKEGFTALKSAREGKIALRQPATSTYRRGSRDHTNLPAMGQNRG
jgi:hypothetical protein